jgi:hypothetical protein
MRGRLQYSLSSILWFTLCLALLLSSILMYRRMSKAEAENTRLRFEPAYVDVNLPLVSVDVLCRVTSLRHIADSISVSRWALVFGVPDGEDPDKYVVGTVLTKTIHWQIEKDSKTENKK